MHDARLTDPSRSFALRVPDGPVTVGADADRLAQVVVNLLANTRAHTPAGTHVQVTLTAAGSAAVLEVADDGPGIRAQAAAHVFERFYRADPSRARASGGSGLGLSIAAAVVAAHRGTLDLRTAPGKGAVFTVTLPLAGAAPTPSG